MADASLRRVEDNAALPSGGLRLGLRRRQARTCGADILVCWFQAASCRLDTRQGCLATGRLGSLPLRARPTDSRARPRRTTWFLALGTRAFRPGTCRLRQRMDTLRHGTRAFSTGTCAFLVGVRRFPSGTRAFLSGAGMFPSGTCAFVVGTCRFRIGTRTFRTRTRAFRVLYLSKPPFRSAFAAKRDSNSTIFFNIFDRNAPFRTYL